MSKLHEHSVLIVCHRVALLLKALVNAKVSPAETTAKEVEEPSGREPVVRC